MKYTFINGEKQQTVEIPDEIIKKHKRTLGCTTSEAINLFLFDEGYIKNDEVTKLTNDNASLKLQLQELIDKIDKIKRK